MVQWWQGCTTAKGTLARALCAEAGGLPGPAPRTDVASSSICMRLYRLSSSYSVKPWAWDQEGRSTISTVWCGKTSQVVSGVGSAVLGSVYTHGGRQASTRSAQPTRVTERSTSAYHLLEEQPLLAIEGLLV